MLSGEREREYIYNCTINAARESSVKTARYLCTNLNGVLSFWLLVVRTSLQLQRESIVWPQILVW